MRELARDRRVRYRRRIAIAVAATLVVLVGTGFGTYALTRDEPTYVESIGCYDRAALDANVSVIGNTAQDPVAACADVWRQGAVAPGTSEAPPLQACVLETGAVAVLPGSGPAVCHGVGIAPLPSRERAVFRRLGALQVALTDRLAGCLPPTAARAAVRELLDRHGFAGWAVAGDVAVSAERPCVGAVIERAQQRVVLISEPR